MDGILFLLAIALLLTIGILCGIQIQKARTPKTEVDEIKKLADDMYYAAQYLTTDASRLRKAMAEYKHYIDYEYLKEAKQKLFEKK